MKHHAKLILLPALVLLFCFCERPEETHDFSGELTDEEIEGGRLTPEILWKFGRVGSSQLSPDGNTVVYTVSRYDHKSNKSMTEICALDIENLEVTILTSHQGANTSPRWHPDGEKIGFLSDETDKMQLWEMNPDGSGKTQLTDIEGGITGFDYSPAGTHVYYTKQVKLDETPAEKHPDLPHMNVRIEDDLMFRHWDQWHNYSYSHIFVAEYSHGQLDEGKDIMEGEKYDSPLAPFYDQAQITWCPEGKIIAYTSKKLKGVDYAVSTNSNIFFYDIETGETAKITEGEGYDRYPVFSPCGKYMAWQSMETPGYESDKARLFLYNRENGVKTYLTRDFEENASDFVWSRDSDIIYFISGTNATYQVFSINVNTRHINQVTSGYHNYTSIGKKGNTLIGEKMSMSMATELFQIDPAAGEETQLTFTNSHIYDNIEMGRVEEHWVSTTDDKSMLVWLILPPDFDSNKEYPALLYCQGGPQSAVSQFFSYRWNFQLMAANDYVIVAPNRRGLPTFGQEWNRQISGDWGGQAMDDYLSAIDAMKEKPFIDRDRLGAVGASFGGYSTFKLAGMHERRFKAFIAHNGVYNLESMYGATEEIFFVNHDLEGPYWKRPKPVSYDEFSPHRFVQHWDTPMLIITSEKDYRVPYTEGLQAFTAARLQGIPSRLLHFPEENHWILQPQNGIVWQREFFAWLDKWVK